MSAQHRLHIPVLAGLLVASGLACEISPTRLEYPAARLSEQVDAYHGVEVPDPYRWLEDPNSEETRRWIEAENRVSFTFLGEILERERIRTRLMQLWNYERYSVPAQHGGRLFYRKNDGLQDQSVLFVSQLDGSDPRVLIDPNELSPDRTVALARTVPSSDGRLLAYGLSDGGSDWRTWHVLDVETGRQLEDVVTGNKFGGVAWAGDMSGFFYPRYDRPPEGTELFAKNAPPDICFHRLGTPEEADDLVVPRPADEGMSHGFSLTEDKSALVLNRWEAASRNNELYFVPLAPSAESETAVRAEVQIPLAQGFDARYRYVGDDGTTLWVLTNLDAPRWRVVAIDPTAPDRGSWREIVPETKQAIESVRSVGGRLFVEYLHDATSRITVFDPGGEALGEVELPGIGSASGFGGEPDDTVTYYSYTDFTHPPTIYRYDLGTATSTVFRQPSLRFDPDVFETRQVFSRSADGTQVPLFLTYKKGFLYDGQNPVYLYGYGGFNVSMTPFFSASNLVWLEMGGILAVACLRGGGEYGEEWHEEGTKLQKQNVFDDFFGAAEYLIRNRFTMPNRLAIGGGSNGGLLVGACLTQRPELFGAALPAVGVMDMLRYHRFTIGWAWEGDYGTSDDPEEFAALHAYSPLHNIEPHTVYPATLITTADHDDRVVPAHSFKFAAALQAAQAGEAPILIRIATRAGHGAGKPIYKRLDEAADSWAFLVQELDLVVPRTW